MQVKADWTFQKYDIIGEQLREYLIAMHGKEYSEEFWKILCEYKEGYIMDPEYSIVDALKHVRCSSLVINGDRDFYFDVNHALTGYKKMKQSQLWIVPGTGHDVHMENKEEFISVVSKFLKK